MQGQQDGEQKSQNTLNADGGYSFKENVEKHRRACSWFAGLRYFEEKSIMKGYFVLVTNIIYRRCNAAPNTWRLIANESHVEGNCHIHPIPPTSSLGYGSRSLLFEVQLHIHIGVHFHLSWKGATRVTFNRAPAKINFNRTAMYVIHFESRRFQC